MHRSQGKHLLQSESMASSIASLPERASGVRSNVSIFCGGIIESLFVNLIVPEANMVWVDE